MSPRNHNKNTTSVHYRRLALQRNRAMYIAAFVFGHDVDSYFLKTPRKCSIEVDKTIHVRTFSPTDKTYAYPH